MIYQNEIFNPLLKKFSSSISFQFRLICLLLVITFFSCTKNHLPLTLYISNASIIDGTGKPAFKANIGINGDQIVYISEKNIVVNDSVPIINAQGKVLAPGFIDLHAHGSLEETTEFENFLAMGVTSIALGQDGSSPYKRNLGAYLDSISQYGFGPNVLMFTGHGTLRNLASIGTEPNPTEAQLDSLSAILNDHLQYCFGMSTGLEYSPGLNAQENELTLLAKIVGQHNRMIMSHMRNEDDDQIINSINELAQQGEFCKVHIAHLKSVYGKGEQRAIEILDYIKSLRNNGIEITADIYPYTASYTGISILFPEWSKTNQQFNKIKTSRRAELQDFLKNKVESRNGPEATLLGTAPYTGKTLADLQKEWGISYVDILIDSIGPQGASAAYFVMDEDLQETFIKDPLIAFCSDGSPTGFHPRGHGTFARIIQEFVIERKVLSLEEAIRKMTGYSAEILGLEDRGTIKIGNKADIIIFDPESVKENATYENPLQLAEGFDIVIVNGKIARENGKLILPFNGELLKPKSPTPK